MPSALCVVEAILHISETDKDLVLIKCIDEVLERLVTFLSGDVLEKSVALDLILDLLFSLDQFHIGILLGELLVKLEFFGVLKKDGPLDLLLLLSLL